jgi:hypothetical protein
MVTHGVKGGMVLMAQHALVGHYNLAKQALGLSPLVLQSQPR